MQIINPQVQTYSDGQIAKALERELRTGLQLKKAWEQKREIEAAHEAKQLKGQKAVAGLAATVQNPGVKLVHLGDTVFMTIIKGKGFVEFHPLYVNRDIGSLTKDLNIYVNYLKNIGVQVMFTYGGEDFPYEDIIKESEFDFEEKKVNDQTAYYLEV